MAEEASPPMHTQFDPFQEASFLAAQWPPNVIDENFSFVMVFVPCVAVLASRVNLLQAPVLSLGLTGGTLTLCSRLSSRFDGMTVSTLEI